MNRAARTALFLWALVSGLAAASWLWLHLWQDGRGLQVAVQRGPFTELTLALLSVAAAWTAAGLLLFLLALNRIHAGNALAWAGFFLIAFVYINLLRERPEYGDIEYYARAALELHAGRPLPPEYFYPPLWANLLEFLVPFGEKAIFHAAWALNLLSLLGFYALLFRVLQRYDFPSRLSVLVIVLFLLVNTPLLRTLFYVQVNLHVVNLIFLALLLYPRRPFLSALSLALAVHLKASPAVLMLAFLLERDWKWLGWFVLSLLLVAVPTLAMHGASPFLDFLNNSLSLVRSHGLSFRDNSFDSFFTAVGEFFDLAPLWARVLIYASKILLAAATGFVMFRCISGGAFLSREEDEARLLNALPPLFILMTLASPVVWEHHGIFLALPFLLLLKRLVSPAEQLWFGLAYLLEFLMPTFDFFPWSYGRLAAPLILLGLIYRLTSRRRDAPWFEKAEGWLSGC